MKNTLILLFTCLCFVASAQNIYFIKSYGNNGYDYGRDIKQDLDTGYIATGSSSSFTSGNADAFLLKVDSLGNFKWSYNYGGSGSEWGEAVLPSADGGYALAGYTNSIGAGGFDFYFVKTNNTGVPLITKTYGGSDWDKAYDMVQLPDNGYVMVGETYSYGAGNSDIYIIRTDVNGDTLWTRTYGGAAEDYANAVLLDGDSLVVVGGTKSFGAGMTDGIILKYHIDGTLGWTKIAGKEREDYFTSITSNQNGEYFLGGTRHYYYDQTGYLGDFWIYNMNDDGSLLADTSLTGGSHEFEIANGIAVDYQDNIYFAGSTKSFGYATTDFKTDAFVGRLLNNYYQGNYINNFGVAGNEVVNAFYNTYDKGFIGIGNTEFKSTGGSNLFILKVDKDNTTGSITVTTELSNEAITLAVEDLDDLNEQLQVYPTLVNDFIHIEGMQGSFVINIIDLTGRVVLQSETSSLLNLSKLTKGLYLLQIKQGNLQKQVKIVKS
ncbi:hypothetical protein DNU06_06575 [Putridiphycobacter roseus]|uniref:Secretion system C-terminal sorting domain-containing protein n=1 Tax=Putridiphycobacter roseus TaxID=2219161 RepID=A0A2W1NS54_9FLAO|nr:T9SS type A sorting domain-containing protein [Putridiphycobacter roseus]PZE17488.1 hypothetical protein DNU06_06575 [Putridiphycobacter roseus]